MSISTHSTNDAATDGYYDVLSRTAMDELSQIEGVPLMLLLYNYYLMDRYAAIIKLMNRTLIFHAIILCINIPRVLATAHAHLKGAKL